MSTNLSKSEIENLLTIEVEPLSRKIGEFRLEPFKSMPFNSLGSRHWIWRVHPNFSDVFFYFPKLTLAESFCKRFCNHHTNDFWVNLWNKEMCYSYEYASKLSSSISYAL